MAKTPTTTQRRAELKRLGQEAARNIHTMLALVDEILQDHEYVDQFGGEPMLIDQMQETEFAHFGGVPPLAAMVRAYRKNPDLETWRKYRFNVRAMIDLATPQPDGVDKERINWKALAKELEARVEQLESVVAEYRTTITELREKNSELVAANGELRGQIQILRQYGGQMRVPA